MRLRAQRVPDGMTNCQRRTFTKLHSAFDIMRTGRTPESFDHWFGAAYITFRDTASIEFPLQRPAVAGALGRIFAEWGPETRDLFSVLLLVEDFGHFIGAPGQTLETFIGYLGEQFLGKSPLKVIGEWAEKSAWLARPRGTVPDTLRLSIGDRMRGVAAHGRLLEGARLMNLPSQYAESLFPPLVLHTIAK